MLEIKSLASGSKGNCVLIDNGKTKILIDAGISNRQIITKLASLDIFINDISCVLITHEHIDHIKSVEKILPFLPVYASFDTIDAIIYKNNKISFDAITPLGDTLNVEDIKITKLSTSHDAIDSIGFLIEDNDSKIAYLTDLGYMPKDLLERIKGVNKILLESNHDIELLKNGKYTPSLKQRILSKKGHLSNDDCAVVVTELVKNGTSSILLGHLSEENNLPELAYWTTKNLLDKENINNESYILKVASQKEIICI